MGLIALLVLLFNYQHLGWNQWELPSGFHQPLISWGQGGFREQENEENIHFWVYLSVLPLEIQQDKPAVSSLHNLNSSCKRSPNLKHP